MDTSNGRGGGIRDVFDVLVCPIERIGVQPAALPFAEDGSAKLIDMDCPDRSAACLDGVIGPAVGFLKKSHSN
jgi:hypothetical protein